MKAIVFVKEVPETPDGVTVSTDGQLEESGAASFLTDPIDPYSLETALQLKGQVGGEVVAITLGTGHAEKVLKEALAMGVDDTALISDDAAVGGDPTATARVLAAAAKHSGDYDIIVTGDRSADSNAGTVGPAIAKILDIPVLTYVSEIREFDADAKKIQVVRNVEGGRQVVESALPAVVSVVKGLHRVLATGPGEGRDSLEPRYPSLLGIRKASKREVPVWSLADLGVEPGTAGSAGSPTLFRSLDPPPLPSECEMVEGDADEMAASIVGKIMAKKVL